MFDDTLFELVNSIKRDELEDLVCEVMTICDELKACLSDTCELGYFEACARQSACELMLDNYRDELARLGFELEWGVEDYPVVSPVRQFEFTCIPSRGVASAELSSRDDLDIVC